MHFFTSDEDGIYFDIFDGDRCALFYRCEITQDFGPYKVGEKFGLIIIDFQNSQIIFHRKVPISGQIGEIFEFKLIPIKK